jgi:pimeloyl-ACP methyl ester carboxylesterase
MVQDRQIDLGRLSFHYRDWGGRGRPMVLLHGLASQSHIFDYVSPLLRQNFRVAALDQRGHGESAKPDAGYDFETICGDLAKFLDALKLKRAILVGHSWGGNVVLEYAAKHPEKVLALILVDGGFLDIQANPDMTWERTEEMLAPPKLAGTPIEQFKLMLKEYAGKMWKPTLEDVILKNFEVMPDRTIRPHLSFDHHMKILRAMWEQRPSVFYPQLICPTLLLPAVSDDTNERARAMAAVKRIEIARAQKLISHSETIWFNHTVHDIPLHRPRKLANVITRFCANNL